MLRGSGTMPLPMPTTCSQKQKVEHLEADHPVHDGNAMIGRAPLDGASDFVIHHSNESHRQLLPYNDGSHPQGSVAALHQAPNADGGANKYNNARTLNSIQSKSTHHGGSNTAGSNTESNNTAGSNESKVNQEKATTEKTTPQIQLPKSYKSRQPNPIDEIQGSSLFHTAGGPAVGRAPVAGALADQKEATAPQVLTGKGVFAQ